MQLNVRVRTKEGEIQNLRRELLLAMPSDAPLLSKSGDVKVNYKVSDF